MRFPSCAIQTMTRSSAFDPACLDDVPKSIRQFYDYWNAIRGDRRMPRRADFDPMAIPRHLPSILLVDVEGLRADGKGKYRYRVAGDLEIAARGFNPTGMRVEDGFLAGSVEEVIAVYETVRLNCEPICLPTVYVRESGLRIDDFTFMVPLSEDGETVSQILVFSDDREKP